MGEAALLSVSDKRGLEEFARGLSELGMTLLASGGTANYLVERGVECTRIEDYTGQKEILGGRVKTLHPKIHAGLLAKRDDPDHMAQLEQEGILTIAVAAINLYPFTQHLKSESADDAKKMVELVDIGGPTMIRAAAKNFESVYPVISPQDYSRVLASLSDSDLQAEALELRLNLATKVFAELADYNLQIAKYFSHVDVSREHGRLAVDRSTDFELGRFTGGVLEKRQTLRYGENPHQLGGFYQSIRHSVGSAKDETWQQLNGKELSYNNFLDFDAAWRLIQSFPRDQPTSVILKHLNPCGAACADTALGALQKAKKGDPRSHFGGIIAFNREVTLDVAEEVAADFAEIVVAPNFAPDALEKLQKKKNLRVIQVELEFANLYEMRNSADGVLYQQRDIDLSTVEEASAVSSRNPSETEMRDLQFAWLICAHVKSNAIALVKDQMLLGVGAGQMSRIDAVELALWKAKTHKHQLEGAVAASDAFFPFTDCVEVLCEQGVSAVIAPKGAKRDQEVVDAVDQSEMALLFTSDRHFRH